MRDAFLIALRNIKKSHQGRDPSEKKKRKIKNKKLNEIGNRKQRFTRKNMCKTISCALSNESNMKRFQNHTKTRAFRLI